MCTEKSCMKFIKQFIADRQKPRGPDSAQEVTLEAARMIEMFDSNLSTLPSDYLSQNPRAKKRYDENVPTLRRLLNALTSVEKPLVSANEWPEGVEVPRELFLVKYQSTVEKHNTGLFERKLRRKDLAKPREFVFVLKEFLDSTVLRPHPWDM